MVFDLTDTSKNEGDLYILDKNLPDAFAGDEYIVKDGHFIHQGSCIKYAANKQFVKYPTSLDYNFFFSKKEVELKNADERPIFSYKDLEAAFYAARKWEFNFGMQKSEEMAGYFRYNAYFKSFNDYIRAIGSVEGDKMDDQISK